MWRVLAIAVVLIGCYEDPDYGSTRFRCDATHPCPSGQTCVGGRCSGGTGDDATTAAGVACGTSTCTTAQRCCVDFVVAPRCIASGATCSGLAASCDGIEDCDGKPCCDTGGGSVIACGTSCQNQICLEPADCTNTGQGMCCFGLGAGEPWGRCLASCP